MLQKIIIILITFIISAGTMPFVIRFCKKHNLYDSVNGRKVHSGSIPRLGGVGIALSFVAGSLIYTLAFGGISFHHILPLLIAGIIIFVFGFIDDLLNLPALVKLLVQLISVTIVIIGKYRFTTICTLQLPIVISVILTFGWVLGIINAFNLIDGLDGLCGGISFLAFVTVGSCLIITGSPEGIVCLILAASVLGFLCFNKPPAKIFMGDCGSQFLGFMIAVAPLYDSSPKFLYTQFFFMLVMVSVPMLDTLAAMWRRIREGKSIMHPDKFHVHHKLLNVGLSKVQAMLVLVGVQFIVCAGAIGSCFIEEDKIRAIVLLSEFVFVICLYAVLHYVHKYVMHKKGLPADEQEAEWLEKGLSLSAKKSDAENSVNTEENK